MAENTPQLEAELEELRNELREMKENSLTKEDIVNMFSDLIQNRDSRIFLHNTNLQFHHDKVKRMAIGTGDFGNGEIAFYETFSGANLPTGFISAPNGINGVLLFANGLPPSELLVAPGTITLELFATGSSNRINLNSGTGLIVIDALPTSDPSVTGALWNSAGTVKVS